MSFLINKQDHLSSSSFLLMDSTTSGIMYRFNDVLVADAQLVPTNLLGPQPEVIVLNSKLYRCQPQNMNLETSEQTSAKCSSCCLQIHRSDFRRRSLGWRRESSSVEQDQDSGCLAYCGKRQSMNVELNTESQISGNLVILAISGADLFIGSNGTHAHQDADFVACKPLSSWAFAKFEPNNLVRSNRKLGDEDNAKQTAHYSRLGPKQRPSIRVSMVQLRREPQDGRPVLALSVQSLDRQSDGRRIVERESLLVTELQCQPTRLQLTSEGVYDEQDDAQTTTIHLMTLINRQTSVLQPTIEPEPARVWQPPTSVLITDWDKEEPMSSVPAISLQLDKSRVSQGQVQGITNLRNSSSPTNQLANMPHHGNRYKFKLDSLATNMGSAYLDDTTRSHSDDSMIQGLQFLRSSSSLALAISSGLIVLTYTLCLLVYLKWRHRFKPRLTNFAPNSDNVSFREQTTQLANQAPRYQISQPYNLKMPPATRTRLNMMLRDTAVKTNFGSTSNGPMQFDLTSANHVQEHAELTGLRCELYNRHQVCCADPLDFFEGQKYELMRGQRNNFGTMVRAIRQAATLARSRIKLSRYRPNLNVIPESDLEQLQSPGNQLAQSQANVGQDQRDAQYLIRDAMNVECSHYLGRMQASKARDQSTKTLLAKPPDTGQVLKPDDAISRRQILMVAREDERDSYSQIDCVP